MTGTRQIALITGAGSGVGRHVARTLNVAGFDLVLAGRRAEKLAETAAAMPSAQGRVLIQPTDVGRPDSVAELFDAIEQEYGRLDVLFNNAGTNIPATPLEEIRFADWQAVLAANLTGVFLCTQGALRLMKRQQPAGGRIINNGSISAHAPRPNAAPYTATKHAVTGLTRATSLEGRPYGIACGQIDIGNAATEMTERMQEGVLQADGSVAAEPTIDADHVARAVLYMSTLPLDANVQFMTVMATGMPYIGRG